ncbi:Protein LTV1 [Cyphellophora attinorum]|uniref:Protein LTV1 n=1 Tax=Cyphellophora attinorum TaxID=1664694 RepID=A0A0N1H798_9EURO|nr:Protein LTV1 [Phialophora attinorum]KPI42270.1 Protein LTV1 [Phialophora attinorum]
MPRRKWIDKKNAQTYKLLYRSQDDPLIHDEGERALFPVGEVATSSQRPFIDSGLHIDDLEQDVDLESMRDNEGEAAEHGVFFDDTKYDYMQHLRDLGNGAGESHYIDAIPTKVQSKGKGKAKQMRLEDALAQATIEDDEEADEDEAPSLVDRSLYAYSNYTATSKSRQLESQQDVPDEIAGFQPDMDPRLREVLEALEDDAYVDEKDDDDVFGSLGRDGKNGELSLDEFEYDYGEDDEGWESDATEKAPEQPTTSQPSPSGPISLSNEFSIESAEAAAAEDGDWLRDFAKHKRDAAAAARKAPPPAAASIVAASAVQDQAPSLYTLNGTPLRQKKRKGALTNPSAYSMTSSSLARTDGQQLLDARFDKVEKMYSVDEGDEFDEDVDGGMSLASGMTGQSKMSQLSTTSFADEGAVRQDFDSMMDGFLGDWNKANPGGGKRKGNKGKRGKHGNEAFGLQQLDEVRAELGPARMYTRRAAAAQKT